MKFYFIDPSDFKKN